LRLLSTAPGKMILIGEYVVLEGAPALVCAVDRYARVTLAPSENKTHRLHSPTLHIASLPFEITANGKVHFLTDLSPEQQNQLKFFRETLQFTFGRLVSNKTVPPIEIHLDTNDFFLPENKIKLGLGSSAALIVALLTALLHYPGKHSNRDISPRDILSLAFTAHYRAQGKMGSGIDIAASVFGGILQYQLSRDSTKAPGKVKKLTLPEDLNIIPIWSGKPASTRQFVKKVQKFKSANPEKYHQIAEEMQRLSREAILAITSRETGKFLEMADRYYAALDTLGKFSHADIISDSHRQIARIVQEAGGVYKPSGAGGGDLGLAFTDSPQLAQKVSDRVLHSGFDIIKLAPSLSGVKIELVE